MKSYTQFRDELSESAINSYIQEWESCLSNLDEVTRQHIEDFEALDEESKRNIIDAINNGDEELYEGVGKWLSKAASVAGKIPFVQQAYGLGLGTYRALKGQPAHKVALGYGQALPGPFGWAAFGADVADDLRPKGNKKNNTPGQTSTPGQTTTPGQTGQTTTKTPKKQPVKLNFNFPRRDIKTKGSVGNPKTDAWSSKYTGGQNKTTPAINMKGTEKIHQAKDKEYEKEVNKNRSKNYSWRR